MQQHIITDEEIERFKEVFLPHPGSYNESRKAALLDFLNNRPESTLGKLRPIAEMSENPPEGCVRFTCDKHGDEGPDEYRSLFCDALLPRPDPETEERQRFEEAIQSDEEFRDSHLEWKDGEYVCKAVRNAFVGWKLRSKQAKQPN